MRTREDLQQKQALPLSIKVSLTKARIREWVNEYGLDHVFVSFSGGKDSTVLLHIAREMYPDIKAVYADTGLEYPELREFVRSFDNVDWIKPKMGFKDVINKYGYPFISKEVSECVYGARKYLTRLIEEGTILTNERTNERTKIPYAYRHRQLMGTDEFAKPNNSSGVGGGIAHHSLPQNTTSRLDRENTIITSSKQVNCLGQVDTAALNKCSRGGVR